MTDVYSARRQSWQMMAVIISLSTVVGLLSMSG